MVSRCCLAHAGCEALVTPTSHAPTRDRSGSRASRPPRLTTRPTMQSLVAASQPRHHHPHTRLLTVTATTTTNHRRLDPRLGVCERPPGPSTITTSTTRSQTSRCSRCRSSSNNNSFCYSNSKWRSFRCSGRWKGTTRRRGLGCRANPTTLHDHGTTLHDHETFLHDHGTTLHDHETFLHDHETFLRDRETTLHGHTAGAPLG